jgi:hypothetical protein
MSIPSMPVKVHFPRPLPSWKVCAATVWLLALAVGSVQGQTGSSSSVGYIDSAIPCDQFRLRLEAGIDANHPERADFFYSKNAPGPAIDNHVNYEEEYSYLELAPLSCLSIFIELPYRWLQPDVNPHQRGLSDLDFGFKYAFVNDEDTVLTFLWRTYAPTADGLRGLGTHNWNVEPELLYYQRLWDNLTVECELRGFIPVASADDFAGNVLRYGAGVSYLICDRPNFKATPVVEIVGWTVLSGKEAIGTEAVSATGEEIVNAKFGVRFRFDDGEPGKLGNSDLYVGYGRALTGTFWYKNLFRVEYRLRF